jgi:hypothetical protein
MADTTQITLIERTQIIATFWQAADETPFPPEVAEIVLNSPRASLETMRSRGTGPKFLSAGGGKKILYTKGAIRDWLATRMVSAANCAEARQLEDARAAL